MDALPTRIPIIWLDTSLYINFSHLLEGSIRNDLSERTKRLLKILLQKTNETKLVCPFGDQNEEFEHGDRGGGLCSEIARMLSRGIVFRHRSEIQAIQRYNALKKFLAGETEFTPDFKEAFGNDSLERLSRRMSKGGFWAGGLASRSILDREKASKIVTAEDLEANRGERFDLKIKYEEQLQAEYLSDYETAQRLIDVNRDLSRLTADDIPSFARTVDLIHGPLGWIEGITKRRGDTAMLLEFYKAPIYRRIPSFDIRCRLHAFIATHPTEVEAGDSMDIQQLSAIFPYCDIIVADRRMRNRLSIDLKIDRDYATEVYCLHDFDRLMDRLERL
jgi:hypothetical protein